MEGHLSKLRIYSFFDIDFRSPFGQAFEAYFNPASYSVGYESKYCGSEALGATDSEMRFIRLPGRTYTFTLEIDGTGASGPKVSVPAEVTKFMAATYQYQGKKKRPPFLILSWGTMLAKCVLTSVSVEYTLFAPNGVPLRARLNTSFKTVNAKAITDAIKDKFKDNTTVAAIAEEGKTLSGMVQEAYGSPAHIIAVAAANGLSNIKKLPAGLQMIFPPKSKDK